MSGAELLRILSAHKEVEITAVTSERSAGKSPADLFPALHRYEHLRFEPLDKDKLLDKADVFFMALPHGASQEAVAFFHEKGKVPLREYSKKERRNLLLQNIWTVLLGTPFLVYLTVSMQYGSLNYKRWPEIVEQQQIQETLRQQESYSQEFQVLDQNKDCKIDSTEFIYRK